MKKIIFTLVFCFSLVVTSLAQIINAEQISQDLGIPLEEFEDLKVRIVEKVDDFQRSLQDLAGRGQVSHEAKMELYKWTIRLFIGEGQPYVIRVATPYGYREERNDAVTMQYINSKYKKNQKTTQPMTSYLRELIRRSEIPNYRYHQILIEAADMVRLDNFTPIGEGRFMATAHILQHFVGYGKEGIKYQDYTQKKIEIYINQLIIDTPDGEQKIWDIRLGNVTSDDIW